MAKMVNTAQNSSGIGNIEA